MNRTIRFAAVVLGLLAGVGCTQTGDETHFLTEKIVPVRMDLSETDSLIVVDSAESGEPTLFKLLDNIELEMVRYFDKDNKEVQMGAPRKIISLSETLLLIELPDRSEEIGNTRFVHNRAVYLVDKESGAIFVVLQRENYATSAPLLVSARIGASGDIYALMYDQIAQETETMDDMSSGADPDGAPTGIVPTPFPTILNRVNKISFDGLAAIREFLTPESHDVEYFIEGNEHLLYRSWAAQTDIVGGGGTGSLPGAEPDWWLLNKSGSLKDAALGDREVFSTRSNDYIMHDSSSNEISYSKIKIDASGELDIRLFVDQQSLPGLCDLNTHLLELEEYTLLFCEDSNQDPQILYLEQPSAAPELVSVEFLPSLSNGTTIADQGRLFDRDSERIQMFDIETRSTITLVEPGSYEIQDFVVGDRGQVLFDALRLSDAAQISAIVNTEGKVTEIEERPFDGEVQLLVRIR